jgi:hypothetical protein
MGNARCTVESPSRDAESLAHMLAAQAPVIAAMGENHQPVWRRFGEPHR